MLKILLITCLGLFIVLFAFILFAPAKAGHLVYELMTGIESKAYGLSETENDIGEMKISLYQNKLEQRPTIVMLHGFSADKDAWIRFARYFTDDFNVVIPDLAGHGATGYDDSWDYSISAQAARVADLIDQLGIEKVHIIGNSMGGFISANFALMYPDKTLSMALVDPAGVNSPEPSPMMGMLAQGQNPFLLQSREEFDRFYAMTMEKPPVAPDFVLEWISEKYQQRQSELAHIFGFIVSSPTLDASLHEINAPSLLLWGEKDQLIDVSSVQIWEAGIDKIQVKIWPAIGHMPMIEIPQQSAEVYKGFLSGL